MSVVEKLPLEVLSSVKSTRDIASFLLSLNACASLYILLFAGFTESYVAQPIVISYILIAVFYGVAYSRLSLGIKSKSVSQGWLTAVNIISLIYIVSVIGILVVIQLFSNSMKVSQFKRDGHEAFASDKAWRSKNLNERSDRKSLILSLIAGLMLGILSGFLALSRADLERIKLQAQEPEVNIAQEFVDIMNEDSVYPEDIGSGVTIDAVKMHENDVMIDYTSSGIDLRGVDRELVDRNNVKSMCNNPGAREVLDAGHKIILNYYFPASDDMHVSTISVDDCAFEDS